MNFVVYPLLPVRVLVCCSHWVLRDEESIVHTSADQGRPTSGRLLSFRYIENNEPFPSAY